MNTQFEKFLDQQYIEQEPLLTTLNEFGWYSLLAKRFDLIIATKKPNYLTIVPTMIQSINDKLRTLTDPVRKQKIENLLSVLFLDMLAYLVKKKPGFHEQLPEMIDSIRATYEVNGDDFSALERLVDFDRFIQNIKNASPISQPYKTRHLKWIHPTIPLQHVCRCMKDYSLITHDSNFQDLFEMVETRRIIVPKKYMKSFALIMGRLFDPEMIQSVGGKSTYSFVEEHARVEGSLQPFSKDYMKRTVDNTYKIGVGLKKHEKIINDFMRDITQISGL